MNELKYTSRKVADNPMGSKIIEYTLHGGTYDGWTYEATADDYGTTFLNGDVYLRDGKAFSMSYMGTVTVDAGMLRDYIEKHGERLRANQKK